MYRENMPAKYRRKCILAAGAAPLQKVSIVLLVIVARFGGGTGASNIDQDVTLPRRLGVGRGSIHQKNNASKTRNIAGASNARTGRRTESNDTSTVLRFVCVCEACCSHHEHCSWPPGMCSFYVPYSSTP